MSDPNPNDPPAPPPAPETVSMTRAELDALINGRVGQAVAQTEKKYKGQAIPAEIQAELDAARTSKAEQERKELERKGEYQKALDAQAKALEDKYKPEAEKLRETISKRDERLRKEIVTNGLLSAAATGNAISPDEVVALLGSRVRLNDDFVPEVIDDAGNPRFGSDGQPMTPAQLVEEFLRARPYFVKASGGKAGGATGGATTKGSGDVGVIAEKEKEVAELADQAARNTSNLGLLVKHSRAVKELAELKSKSA